MNADNMVPLGAVVTIRATGKMAAVAARTEPCLGLAYLLDDGEAPLAWREASEIEWTALDGRRRRRRAA